MIEKTDNIIVERSGTNYKAEAYKFLEKPNTYTQNESGSVTLDLDYPYHYFTLSGDVDIRGVSNIPEGGYSKQTVILIDKQTTTTHKVDFPLTWNISGRFIPESYNIFVLHYSNHNGIGNQVRGYWINEATGVPQRVGFSAKTASNVLSANTETVVDFTFEIDDPRNAWDGSTFTVPSDGAGMYEIYGHAYFANVLSGNIYQIQVKINDSLSVGGLLSIGNSNGGSINAGGAMRLNLKAGDTIKMVVKCGNSTSMTVPSSIGNGYNTFSAYKML